MSEKKWGKRRICPAPGCGVKYYDMNRQPVTCPDCGATYRKELGTRRQKAAVSEKIPATEMDIEPEIAAITDEDASETQDSESITLPDPEDDHDDLLPEETGDSDLSNMTNTIPTKKTTDE